MIEIELNSWDEFGDTIAKIERDFGVFESIRGTMMKNAIFYRGQSNSDWNLESTLERYSDSRWSIESYTRLLKRIVPDLEPYTRLLKRIVPDLESLTNQRWSFPKSAEWREGDDLPCFEMWVHTRHCGFPSPLLDWTLSPNIAKFFALEKNIKGVKRASVFAYIDSIGAGANVWWGNSPHITHLRAIGKTHKRNYSQQSRYTICTSVQNNEHEFVAHKEVFKSGENNKRQDILFKISIPCGNKKRNEILSDLDRIDKINHFSLFGSEESRMRTLAFREIDLKNLM